MQSGTHDILVNGHEKLDKYSNTKAVSKSNQEYINNLKSKGYEEIFDNDDLSDLVILGLPKKVKKGNSNGKIDGVTESNEV